MASLCKTLRASTLPSARWRRFFPAWTCPISSPPVPRAAPEPALATACPTHPGCHAILPPPHPGFLRACHLDLIHSAKHVQTDCYPTGVVTSRAGRKENKAAPDLGDHPPCGIVVTLPASCWPGKLPPLKLGLKCPCSTQPRQNQPLLPFHIHYVQ